MRKIYAIFSFVLLAGCKEPPNVDPCLIKIQLTNGAVDLTNSKAFCTPVDVKKPKYILTLDKLNKFTAYSNQDQSILLQWIVNNSK